LNAVSFDPASGKIPLQDVPNDLDCFLAIQPSGNSCPLPRINWHYRVGFPAHQLIVLDIRTWRSFSKNPTGSSGLLTEEARQVQLGGYAPGNPTATIVVSPAPVIGLPLVEEAIQKLYTKFKTPEAADAEAWGGNRPVFEAFLRQLAAFGRVILLSGDVHYAFSNSVAYFRDDADNAIQSGSRILQLCSTSLKNEDKLTRLLGGIGHTFYQMDWLGFDRDLHLELKAAIQQNIEQLVLQLIDIHNPGGNPDPAQICFNITALDRLSAPAVIPGAGWYEPALSIVKKVAEEGTGTQWRYRTSFARDQRNDSQRETEMQLLNSPLPHIDSETRSFLLNNARDVIGYGTIGRIYFSGGSGQEEQVTHQLFWYAHPDNDKVTDFAMSNIPLPPLLAKFLSASEGPLTDLLLSTHHSLPFTIPSNIERPKLS